MKQYYCAFSLILLLLAPEASFAQDAAPDPEPERQYPVTKVVNLLKDMKAQLEKEAEEDEEIYDKMACWCETNDKEKTKAIDDAQTKITELGSAIEEGSANSARLAVEIDSAKEELAKNVKALETATALREKEAAEFSEEEKDAIEAIKALTAAIVVLAKHNDPGAVDSAGRLRADVKKAREAELVSIASLVRKQLQEHPELFGEVITPSQKRLIGAFAQQQEKEGEGTQPEAMLQQKQEPGGSSSAPDNSYKPRSGQIFGILKQMKETFEGNLSDSQKEEMAKQEAFAGLKETKEEEIALGKDTIKKKTQELADTKNKLVDDKEDLEDTRNGLSYDQKFLMELKVTCQMTDQDWEARSAARAEEISAISKAINLLTSDDARSLFNKTFNPAAASAAAGASLIQLRSTRVRRTRAEQAAELLKHAAQKKNHGSSSAALLKLASLVSRAGSGLDSFVRVKKAIDDMVAQLLDEKAEEIKKKDYCVEAKNTNIKTTDAVLHERDTLAAKVSALETTIEELTASIASLKSEISNLQEEMKKAGEDREAENVAFQETLSDQRATQKLLQQALSVLKGFYDKHSLLQKQKGKAPMFQEGWQDGPPAGTSSLKGYDKHEAAGGLLAMIEQIITDAKNLEKAAIKDEQDAQAAYEDMVNETNASIDEKEKAITNQSEQKAQAEADKATAEIRHEEVLTELDELGKEKKDLSDECDWLLANFDARQAGRDQEVEALRNVKAILSGAKLEGFLQKREK